jgi:hypothetical protein
MRKFILIPIMVIATLMGCQKSKLEAAAEADVAAAEAALDSAESNQVAVRKAATAAEWQEFKEQANILIQQNKIRIDELKASAKASGDKSMEAIEEKNRQLQNKLESYKNDASEDWEAFKAGFNQDKDDLRRELLNK